MKTNRVLCFINSQQLGCITALFLIFLFVGCKQNKTEEEQSNQVAADVIVLKTEDALVEESYPAKLEGKINIEIRPQVNGYIQKIFVDEGAFVKAGQTLFTINGSVYQEQVNNARAAIEVAKSQVASAKLEMEKYEILNDKKVVSSFQRSKAKISYDEALANLNQQKAVFASASVNLGFTVIKAPVTGYIGRITKRLGSLVSPTDQDALTTLSQVDEIYAYFSLPEAEMLNLYEDGKGSTFLEKLRSLGEISLTMANGKSYPQPGKIDMMDGQFDPMTGSVLLRASFPNSQDMLRSGNTGRIVIKANKQDVLKVPILATYELQDKLFVGLLDNSNIMTRFELKDYIKSGDFYIVQSGLKNGDRIIARELGSIPEKSNIVPTLNQGTHVK